ncbi:OsmC family protein [Bdellovibrio svalbardensis]|uniref:OsmC family protein n=1 Tax=Bdellovibrio svalbardensis TaxID=2972972 RepID=A0ABT6DNI2_9BACT|nr:OsmC family protein [Bdellovibrio svalbardensis]MDG0816693.1 OsmC family protein [Bdellovibrio svalbardensis]
MKSRKFTFHYATDGSKENPLEATYAALAGCAGVYALKACKKKDLSALGIKISGKPYLDKTNPSMITKWVTEVQFPTGWKQEDKEFVMAEIQKCAVKEMIAKGQQVEFVTEEVVES